MHTSCTKELATKVSALVTSKSYLRNSSLEETLSIKTPCHGMCLNMYQMFILTRNTSTIQQKLPPIETARRTFSEWKQYMSVVYVKCECVQHLALSAITLCSNISLMTRKGMGLKGSKMSMADQGLDQEDPDKGDQDK